MKKTLSLSLLFFLFTSVFGQTKLDTLVEAHTKKIETIEKKVTGIQLNIDSIKAKTDSLSALGKALKASTGCADCNITFWQWVLVFSPILVFIIALFVIKKKLNGFDLREALSESELPKKTVANPEYTAEKLNTLANNTALAGTLQMLIPPTIEITASLEYPKSSSRYIAFITSALTWIIALCLTCFFLYQYIRTGSAPKLDGLSDVLLALGIGVVPYAFNKMSNAISK